MVEIIPFMLIILGWHPDQPGTLDLQRPEIIFTSVEDCNEAGEKMSEKMNAAAEKQSGSRYEFRCIPAPASEEYQRAFEKMPRRGQ